MNVYKICFETLVKAGSIRPLVLRNCISSSRAVSLLHVCKLVHHEASETLFEKHILILAQFQQSESRNEAITAWLAQIDPSNVLRLRMLNIEFSSGVWMLAHRGGIQGIQGIVALAIPSLAPSYHAAAPTYFAGPFYGGLCAMFYDCALGILHQIEHILALIEHNRDLVDVHLDLPLDNASNLEGHVIKFIDNDGFFFRHASIAAHERLRVAMKKLLNVLNFAV